MCYQNDTKVSRGENCNIKRNSKVLNSYLILFDTMYVHCLEILNLLEFQSFKIKITITIVIYNNLTKIHFF